MRAAMSSTSTIMSSGSMSQNTILAPVRAKAEAVEQKV